MAKTKVSKSASSLNKTLSYTATGFALIALIAGSLAFWAHSFTSNMVRTELAAQKIYFPEKGPALDPKTYPDLQKYAGQLVDTPEEAKAFANGYIGKHLQGIAGGKVYSEVSTEARKDPTNVKLQEQKMSLFQGETLRGILLGTGYAFGTIGKIAGIAAYVLWSIGALLLAGAVWLRRKI